MLDQPFPGISAAAICARLGRWGIKGILFFIAPILPTFVASFGRCTKMLMARCIVMCGMQTIPNPAELTLHVRLKPEEVQAGYARRRKRRDHAKAAVQLGRKEGYSLIPGSQLG